MNAQTWMNDQSHGWQSEMKALRKKDRTLWAFCAALVILLCVTFVALVVPNIWSHSEVIFVDIKNLPQLSLSLLCLVGLFAVQINRERRELSLTRDALFRRLMQEDRKGESIMDPETQTYSTVVLQSVLEKMIVDASADSPLSIIDLQIQSIQAVRRRNGDPAVEHLLRSLAEILRSSLRGSDRVFKSGDTSFTVLMPNTPEDRTQIPVQRIFAAVERWNKAMVSLDYRMRIGVGAVTCTSGEQIGLEVLTKVREQRIRKVPL